MMQALCGAEIVGTNGIRCEFGSKQAMLNAARRLAVAGQLVRVVGYEVAHKLFEDVYEGKNLRKVRLSGDGDRVEARVRMHDSASIGLSLKRGRR